MTARQGWAEERRRWNSLSTDLTQAQLEYFSWPVAVSGCVQSCSSPLKVPLCFKHKSQERASFCPRRRREGICNWSVIKRLPRPRTRDPGRINKLQVGVPVLWVLRSRTGSALLRLISVKLLSNLDYIQVRLGVKGSSGDVEVSLEEANPSLQEMG